MDSFGHHPQPRIHHQHFAAGQSNSGLRHFEKPRFSVAMRAQTSGSKPAVPFKSHFCWLYQKGWCYFGEQCRFAHDINEIRNLGSSGLDVVGGGRHSDSRNGNVGKMTKCRRFSNGKIYPYGDKHQFLPKRDRAECESLNADEDYERGIFQKMKLCNMWEKFGNCPYGVKCLFSHGNAELKTISSHAVPVSGYTSSRFKLRSWQSKGAAKITLETAHKVQPEGKRPFMNWNIDRISRVYADWMDSMDSLLIL